MMKQTDFRKALFRFSEFTMTKKEKTIRPAIDNSRTKVIAL